MPPDLSGPRVRLRVLQPSDGEALIRAASDGALWTLPFTVVPSAATVETYIQTALDGLRAGTMLPYAIEIAASGEVAGSTRFWKMDQRNRKVEIGHSWIAASWQRSFVNTEMKYLMLKYAFEVLRCVRVQLQTDELNQRSRSAILRLGAKEEGLIRNERIMPDGRERNSIRFSIIDDEWPTIKSTLEARLPAS